MMPYAILRFQKRKAGGVAACERHNERKKEAYKSNPDIDMERSKNNYHLVKPPLRSEKSLRFFRLRLQGVTHYTLPCKVVCQTFPLDSLKAGLSPCYPTPCGFG